MKKILTTMLAVLTLAVSGSLLQPAPAYAAACPDATTPSGQVLHGVGQTGGDCDESGVTRIINTVVQILAIVVGIAAVIMVIVSGFKYITSGGDSGRVSSAKTTLIYALVGLAVAALAQLLVTFVLSESNKATQAPAPTNAPASGGTGRPNQGQSQGDGTFEAKP